MRKMLLTEGDVNGKLMKILGGKERNFRLPPSPRRRRSSSASATFRGPDRSRQRSAISRPNPELPATIRESLRELRKGAESQF